VNAPFHPLPLDQPAHASGSSTTDGWPHWSILVVDDEQGMRNFLIKVLAPRCRFVASAASAEEGSEWMQSQRVDLVILDISLPGLNGVNWLKELRAQGYSGEVILITAFADLDTAIEALRAGASDFILKPFRVPQILERHQTRATTAPSCGARTTCCGAMRGCRGPVHRHWSAAPRPRRGCATPSSAWLRCRAPCCSKASRALARNWWRVSCTHAARAPKAPLCP